MTAMGRDIRGKWLIPDAEYPQFLAHLHDYLFIKKYRALNLVEQPRPRDAPKPLLIDLDFKWSADSALERRFGEDHISRFVVQITDGLNNFFDMTQHEGLRFFVSLRPQPYGGGKQIKDGIHIQCPDIALTSNKQKALRSWLLEKHAVRDSFEGTE